MNDDSNTNATGAATEAVTEAATEVQGRRPLNSRGWRVFQILAAWLSHTKITPNKISVSSIVFGVAAGLALAATDLVQSTRMLAILYFLAAAGIQLRLIANLLDGMVAVEGGKRSPVGVLYNEVPDRVSDAAIFIGAGYSLASRPELGLLAAVVAVFVAYVRAIGSSAGAGEVFAGPMAKPQRMALMTGGCVLCGLISAISAEIDGRWQSAVMGTVLGLIIVGGIITSIRRLHLISETIRASTMRAPESSDEQTGDADSVTKE